MLPFAESDDTSKIQMYRDQRDRKMCECAIVSQRRITMRLAEANLPLPGVANSAKDERERARTRAPSQPTLVLALPFAILERTCTTLHQSLRCPAEYTMRHQACPEPSPARTHRGRARLGLASAVSAFRTPRPQRGTERDETRSNSHGRGRLSPTYNPIRLRSGLRPDSTRGTFFHSTSLESSVLVNFTPGAYKHEPGRQERVRVHAQLQGLAWPALREKPS